MDSTNRKEMLTNLSTELIRRDRIITELKTLIEKLLDDNIIAERIQEIMPTTKENIH